MKSENSLKITVESIFRSQKGICDRIIDGDDVWDIILRLSIIIICASGIYGFTMGIRHSYLNLSCYQAISSTIKVPFLFYATLMICFPTLHFLGLFLGSKMRMSKSMSVLLLGIAINSVLLGAFSTISMFFFITGSQYRFLMLMHIMIFAFCGAAGLISISRNLTYVRKSVSSDNNTTKSLLSVWMMLYMFVGTQMAYILSPYVGIMKEFIFLRDPEGNFYTTLFKLITGIIK
jgi:hypothetical protein